MRGLRNLYFLGFGGGGGGGLGRRGGGGFPLLFSTLFFLTLVRLVIQGRVSLLWGERVRLSFIEASHQDLGIHAIGDRLTVNGLMLVLEGAQAITYLMMREGATLELDPEIDGRVVDMPPIDREPGVFRGGRAQLQGARHRGQEGRQYRKQFGPEVKDAEHGRGRRAGGEDERDTQGAIECRRALCHAGEIPVAHVRLDTGIPHVTTEVR